MSEKREIKAIKREDMEKRQKEAVSVEIAHMYVLMERHRDKAKAFLFGMNQKPVANHN